MGAETTIAAKGLPSRWDLPVLAELEVVSYVPSCIPLFVNPAPYEGHLGDKAQGERRMWVADWVRDDEGNPRECSEDDEQGLFPSQVPPPQKEATEKPYLPGARGSQSWQRRTL